ncbi:restriction endonuclease subunit S [Stutzerimonas balearica]|nr:restriction endonuclease subunit S [Stutzerimonas balearica]WAN09611.1 restriction endonuclease subunit S [Stutzerimonas balearica]
MHELPRSWINVQLQEFGTWGSGGTPSKGNGAYYQGDVPWAVIGDLNDGLLTETANKISEAGLANSSAKLIPAETLLIAMYGSIGKLAITGIECCTNQAIAFCKIEDSIADKKYLFYALRWARPELVKLGQGASQQNISQTILKSFKVPLSPRAEQTRIAAKLDELLAQVDTLKARIDGIPALLKRFRQSVLAAAVSGRLTEEWRAGNSNPGWSEIKLEDLLAGAKDGICRGPFGSSIKKEYFVPEGYKVYEQKNAIRDNSLIGEYFVDEKKYKELERFSVRSGDFIVSCAGTLGRISLLPSNAPAGLINQALIRIRTNKKLVLDEYFLLLFKSPSFQEKLVVGARGGAMQNLASTKEIKALEINCPTIFEQAEIVRRVEQLFAFADQLEARVKAAQVRIDRLTQSILAKAFRGELVPQDPNDEPASVLLERIKAQRAAAPKAKRGRKASA